ncbi:MAG: phenylalanine--tRNA ligase subunit beta [Rickettsiales bacterium]|nr:phenylalanine--tRNA ligase subunit beta [Rickettsiales bacterium]
MKLTYSWLKEHIDLSMSPKEVSNELTSLGLEVEKVEELNSDLNNFYICQIVNSYKHPNADRLKICEITTGNNIFKVVCGAHNALKGLKTIFAPNGTFIPGLKIKIEKRNIRGIEGDGMLCSEEELGLSENKAGIIEINNKYKIGKKLSEYFKKDYLFHIALTPNRGDCASVRGIARDLSAKLNIKLKEKKRKKNKGSFKSAVNWNLENTEDCSLIYGRHFKIKKNKESPEWLRNRLLSIGLNPISALVDITNYILFDLGRPLHVFDIKKIKGNLKVLKLEKEENFRGLDKKDYLLKKDDLVIRDNEKTLSLAGIMGGLNSCVDEDTTDVFLEAANFNKGRIANTGRRIGILSDARYRFERGIDPEGILEGLEIATKLIIDICEGTFSESTFSGRNNSRSNLIKYDINSFEKTVGYKIKKEKQIKFLSNLHFKIKKIDKNFLFLLSPSWRHDINTENDIIEEILRLDGYSQIPLTSLATNSIKSKNIVMKRIKKIEIDIRECAAKLGFHETKTFSFISEKKVFPHKIINQDLKIENPISSEMNIMRNSLFPNLLDIVAKNTSKGIESIEIFEAGYVFNGINITDQKSKIALVLSGFETNKTWHFKRRYYDFFDIKVNTLALLSEIGIKKYSILRSDNDWYHPGISADIKLNNKVMGSFGELHPAFKKTFNLRHPTYIAELDIEILNNAIIKDDKKTIKISPYLPLKKDFSFLVNEDTSVKDLIEIVKKSDHRVGSINIFDRYQESNSNVVSIGLEVEFIQKDKVFNSEEINQLMNKIIEKVNKKLGAKLRDT